MHYVTPYPGEPAARDRFIIDLRGPRPRHDPWRYQHLAVEDEPTERGDVARVGTVFLTGRECPWRCAMCDLWRSTTREDTPAGAIPAQVEAALRAWRDRGDAISRLKLYNASNFFDPRAVPDGDYTAIAAAVSGLDQVVVESHPSLIGDRVDRFLDALKGHAGRPSQGHRLEVAMGLETVHPAALDALNKRMTTDDFARAAGELHRRDISLRVFVLIGPPFVPADEQDAWLLKSVAFAEECGASVISLIPTRAGNGAMAALTKQGLFRELSAEDVQRSLSLVIARHPGPQPSALSPSPRLSPRIFLDPWAAHAD
jgi:radical SAM enzyme (TIGR01210 family)